VLSRPGGSKQIEQLGVSELLNALLKNNPRTLTLVLDTSFVAPGDKRCAATDENLKALTDAGRTGNLLLPIIKQVEARGTKCIVLSATNATLSDNHMQALEIDDLNHGLFSSFALEALGGEADANRDRIVTFDEFSKYVGEKVTHIAQLEGKSQTGWFYAGKDRKTFALPSWHQ
jgi:hypothetical protein